MPRLRIPSYRCFKPKGLGQVVIDGQRQLPPDASASPNPVAEYNRLIQEWLARGDSSVSNPDGDDDLTSTIWFSRSGGMRNALPPAGKPSKELANFRDTFRPVRRLYGGPCREFSPLKLKALRKVLIESGLSRNTINQRIGRIVHVFKSGASEELVPASIHQAAKTVSGLQKGRTRPRKRTRPTRSRCARGCIRPFVPRQMWAMIELQRLTGMRSGEVVMMRTADLDRSGKSGPTPRITRCFTGAESGESSSARPLNRLEAVAQGRAGRVPVLPRRGKRRAIRGNAGGEKDPHSALPVGPEGRNETSTRHHYTTRTYYHAVASACNRANVPSWHPNQLRHNAATRLRKDFGLDVARVILGHSSPAVTEVYAEVDRGESDGCHGASRLTT